MGSPVPFIERQSTYPQGILKDYPRTSFTRKQVNFILPNLVNIKTKGTKERELSNRKPFYKDHNKRREKDLEKRKRENKFIDFKITILNKSNNEPKRKESQSLWKSPKKANKAQKQVVTLHPEKKKKQPKAKDIKLLYVNPRGLSSKIKSLKSAAETFQAHFILLAETKLKTKPHKFEGYNWYTRNRKSVGGGGGVAILVRDDIYLLTKEVQGLEDQDQEVLWIEFNTSNRKTYLGVYYGKQETDKIEEVRREFSQLQTQIEKLRMQGNVILAGDFNAKLEIRGNRIQQDQSRNGKLLKELIDDNTLIPISLEKEKEKWTRVNRTKVTEKSVIDYILLSQSMQGCTREINIDEEGILRIKGKKETDHNTMTLAVHLPYEPRQLKIQKWKKGTEEDWKNFNEQLHQSLDKIKIPVHYDALIDSIRTTAKQTVGKKSITLGKKPKTKNPRIKNLRAEKKEKRKSFETLPKNTAEKAQALKEYYTAQTNLREEIENHETELVNRKIELLASEGGIKSGNFWSIRKKILQSKQAAYDLVTETDKKIEDPNKARDYIADYYETLYKEREGNPSHTKWHSHIRQKVREIDNEVIISKDPPIIFTIKELDTAIKSLKSNKATGPDDIPNEVFMNSNRETRIKILKIFNEIAASKQIPEQWRFGEIQPIYKGKGTKGKCSNERGITISSNVGKLFERLANNRMSKELYISDAQAGGKKGRSTADHNLIVDELINITKAQGKAIYLVFLDVSKAYDKAWLEALLYEADRRGVKGQLWKLIKELNSNLTAKVRTKYGETREINLDGTSRQGGITTTGLYSAHIDAVTRETLRIQAGICVNDLLEKIASILWVDDIIAAETDPHNMQKILDCIANIADKYKIEFGEKKSKVMKIGGDHDYKPILKIGDMTLQYVDTYKYLGEVRNSQNNLSDHIEEVRGKAEAAYQTLLSVAQNNNFQNIQMEAVWKMYETCIQPIVTYGSENWNFGELRQKDKDDLNAIQESIIRRILMTPFSTPKEALYMETGLLDIESIALKRRISMQTRLQQNPSELIEKIFQGNTTTWKTKTERVLVEKDIQLETLHTKKHIANRISQIHAVQLKKGIPVKSKLQYLEKTEEVYTTKRKNYIQKLNRKEASTIFKLRTRMLDVKCNYKGSYTNLSCRLCGISQETQDHILFDCQKNPDKINKEDVFQDSDMSKLKKAVEKIVKTVKKVKSAPPNGT